MKKFKHKLIGSLLVCLGLFTTNTFAQTLNTELIPNGSFEFGSTITSDINFFLPLNAGSSSVLDYWTTGYTRNTFNSTLYYGGNPHGSYPSRSREVSLFDYNSNPNFVCTFGPAPNRYGTTATSLLPHTTGGQRFMLIQGGYGATIPDYFEGGSIMTPFDGTNELCDGTFVLEFWVKAPDAELTYTTANPCPIPVAPGSTWQTFTDASYDPENKVEVVLRKSTDATAEMILWESDKVTVGAWVKKTATINISGAVGYDRIELRVKTNVNNPSRRDILIDEISLKKTGVGVFACTEQTETIYCGQSVDLGLISNYSCSNDQWEQVSGTPMETGPLWVVSPTSNCSYSRLCYSPAGCVIGCNTINITVLPNPTQTIDINLCEPGIIPAPTLCHDDNVAWYSWDDVNNQISLPVNPDGSAFIPAAGTYHVTKHYDNGCECTTIINVNFITTTDLSATINACYGETVTLDAFYGPLGNNTILWDGSIRNEMSVKFVALTSTTIVAELVNEYNCVTIRKTFIINVSQPPTYTNVNNVINCGDCITLNTYFCSPPAVTGYWSHLSPNNNQTHQVCPKKNTTYQFICYDANGCPTSIVEHNVTVNQPNASYLTATKTVCTGGELTINIEDEVGPLTNETVEWSDGYGTGKSIVITDDNDGTIVASVYDASGCLLYEVTYTITTTVPTVSGLGFPIYFACHLMGSVILDNPCQAGETGYWEHDPYNSNPYLKINKTYGAYGPFRYICKDANGCIVNIHESEIIWGDPDDETPTITVPITLCLPDCIELDPISDQNLNFTGDVVIKWSNGTYGTTIIYCPEDGEEITARIFEDGCFKYIVKYQFHAATSPIATVTNYPELFVGCGNCIDVSSYKCDYPSSTIWPEGVTQDPITGQMMLCPKNDQELVIKCFNDEENCPSSIIKVPIKVTHPIPTPINMGIYWLCDHANFTPDLSACNIPTNASYEWHFITPETDDYNKIVETNTTGNLPFQSFAVYHPHNVSGSTFELKIFDELGCLVCYQTYNIRWILNGPIKEPIYINGDLELCPGECLTVTYAPELYNASNISNCGWTAINGNASITDLGNGDYEICPIGSLPATFELICTNNMGCPLVKRTITITQKLCKKGATTSVNSMDIITSVNIYPNPSTGVFTLELTNYDLPNTTYTVVDAVGREVMKVENIDSEKSAIDMSRFEKGIYFIRVNQNGAIETKKIIIQ